MNKVYFILPKPSSFLYKSHEEQASMQCFVDAIYQKVSVLPVQIVCFAEDLLALRLFDNKHNIRWYSVISESDRNFLINNDPDVTDAYIDLVPESVNDVLIRRACNKIKPPALSRKEQVTELYNFKRMQVFRERKRHVCDAVLNEALFVVYFDAMNNYCADPTMSDIGSGKIRIKVELPSGREFNYIGGCPIGTEVFYEAIHSMLNR